MARRGTEAQGAGSTGRWYVVILRFPLFMDGYPPQTVVLVTHKPQSVHGDNGGLIGVYGQEYSITRKEAEALAERLRVLEALQ